MTGKHRTTPHDRTIPARRDDDKSGYPERTPRDREDARNPDGKQPRDPDDGGLDREPGDSADPASDDD
ncbi:MULTISPECIES: hypothetical protein [unclassified Luteimonas]